MCGLINLKKLDIMDFIKPITNTKEYKDFCKENGYMTKHKYPRPQMKAETFIDTTILKNTLDLKIV